MDVNTPRDEKWLTQKITQLKVIAQIKGGDKIYTSSTSTFFLEPRSMLQGAWRLWYGENRSKNIEQIGIVVREVIEFSRDTYIQLLPRCHGTGDSINVTNMMNRGRSEISVENSLNTLIQCKMGLRNLSSNYSSDAQIKAEIDNIISDICIFEGEIVKMKSVLPGEDSVGNTSSVETIGLLPIRNT